MNWLQTKSCKLKANLNNHLNSQVMVPSTNLDRNFVPLEEIVYTAQNDSSMAPCLSYISVQCGDQNKVPCWVVQTENKSIDTDQVVEPPSCQAFCLWKLCFGKVYGYLIWWLKINLIQLFFWVKPQSDYKKLRCNVVLEKKMNCKEYT